MSRPNLLLTDQPRAAHTGFGGNEALIEEDEPFDLAGLGQPLRMPMLTTKHGRISIYRDGGELFANASDPAECHNLFDDRGNVPTLVA